MIYIHRHEQHLVYPLSVGVICLIARNRKWRGWPTVEAELQTMLKLVKTPQEWAANLQHPKFLANIGERRNTSNMLRWESASPLRNNSAFKPWVKNRNFKLSTASTRAANVGVSISESTITRKYSHSLIHLSADQLHKCVQNLLDSEIGGATGL